ncbi:MAG: DNA translocase FtsK [Legionellaceae bacterium]
MKTLERIVIPHLSLRLREGIFIVCLALSAFLFCALATYHYSDIVILVEKTKAPIFNIGGKIGAWIASILLYGFGYMSYLLIMLIVYTGFLIYQESYLNLRNGYFLLIIRSIGFLLSIIAGCGLASLFIPRAEFYLSLGAGGAFGDKIGMELVKLLNTMGAILLLSALFFSGITLFSGFSWLQMVDKIGRMGIRFISSIQLKYKAWREKAALKEAQKIKLAEEKREAVKTITKKTVVDVKPIPEKVKPRKIEIADFPAPIKHTQKIASFEGSDEEGIPSLSLLDPPEENKSINYSTAVLESMSREVEARLKDFGIEVHVVAVHPGPVVTRFEMQLAPGLKVSRISALAKDLARSLSVISVRIVEVIPGKSYVGLELPNEKREVVRLSEVLSSLAYDQARSPLSLALGKDISGHSVIVDLAKMPHLLVAGTTGSGKSVGLNAMLLSLLYKATPDLVRMIMIDPKMLELSIYEGIPHLLTPVVTDMKEAANGLRWCVIEMDRRYKLMASLGVRNLAGYNTKIKEAINNGTPIMDPFWHPQQSHQPEELIPLPYIVVLIDEFADMMMVVGKKVEELIARIAQKARAAGIHMILATQRPSVDVITGLIKANIPTRMAFQVSSKIDSRTILDQQGAEQLLGHGDMLYLAPGSGVPVRVHGAFVADQEVHRVVDAWKRRGKPEYINDIVAGYDENSSNASEDETNNSLGNESDPLYDQAVKIVVESRRASISNIQRRLKIGYNRAARMIEEMEMAGIVSPMESNGSREVLAPPPHE